MMISRVLLGLGIGLYSPHAISLISLFYTGEERAYLLGIQMGIAALGNAIFLTMAGFLAKFEWSFAFLVYLFLGGIAWLIYRYVPSTAIGNKKSVGKVPSIDYRTKKYLILCFVTFLIIWGVQLKIPTFLVQNQIYSSGRSGLLLSSMNIAGMIAGFLFGFFFEKLKNSLLPLGFIGAGMAICGMAMSQTWGWIVVFGVFFNFIYSFTGPFIVLKINQGADERQIPKVNAMITTTTILSSYFSPFVWNHVASLFNFSKEMSRTLIMIAVCTLVIGMFLLVYQMVCSKRQKNKQ